MKRTCNSGIDNVIEEIRNAYEEGKNMGFIKDPIAYALWVTWKRYEEKHEEQIRYE